MTNEKIRTLKGTPKHLSQVGELNSFTYLMINFPYECNFRCKKCFNLMNGKPRKYKNLISLEDRLNLIEQASIIGGKAVVFAGEGEPILSNEIECLVKYVNECNMIPIIYSNGSMFDSNIIDFCKSNNSSIIFSFDSLKEGVFSMKSFEKGIFPKTIINITRAIDSLKELTYVKGNLEILSVAINSTISELNINEVKTLKSLWEDAYYICNPIAKSGNDVNNWDFFRGALKDEVIHQVIEENSETGGPLTLTKKGLCGYSIYGISVSPEGNYMTCAYTNKTDNLLGSIREIKLKEAWENKHRIESSYYKNFGNTPCLIRSNFFQEYLNQLKEK